MAKMAQSERAYSPPERGCHQSKSSTTSLDCENVIDIGIGIAALGSDPDMTDIAPLACAMPESDINEVPAAPAAPANLCAAACAAACADCSACGGACAGMHLLVPLGGLLQGV